MLVSSNGTALCDETVSTVACESVLNCDVDHRQRFLGAGSSAFSVSSFHLNEPFSMPRVWSGRGPAGRFRAENCSGISSSSRNVETRSSATPVWGSGVRSTERNTCGSHTCRICTIQVGMTSART